MDVVDRFDTGDESGLVTVHEMLVDREPIDPFADSVRAVETWDNCNWLPLLEHNLSDIRRTYELAQLGHDYVAKSDFGMKSLSPP